MPWKSDAQRRWGNSSSGIAAMGQAKVNEFNKASKGTNPPEKVSNKEHMKKHPHITRIHDPHGRDFQIPPAQNHRHRRGNVSAGL